MIISFAHTTAALLADRKTVTRRDWTAGHAALFRAGQVVDAWDRSPRYGGRRVAQILLERDPYRESTADAPESDYEAEGFAFMEERGLSVDRMTPRELWREWREKPRVLWVVRFRRVA